MRRLRADLNDFTSKPQIAAVGHKIPRYYSDIDRIIREIGDPLVIVCLRDIREICQSFNIRAIDKTDPWPAERDDCAAIAEFSQFSNALQSVDRNRLFFARHHEMMRDWRSLIARLHLKLEIENFDFNESNLWEIDKIKKQRAQVYRPPLSTAAEELLVTDEIRTMKELWAV